MNPALLLDQLQHEAAGADASRSPAIPQPAHRRNRRQPPCRHALNFQPVLPPPEPLHGTATRGEHFAMPVAQHNQSGGFTAGRCPGLQRKRIDFNPVGPAGRIFNFKKPRTCVTPVQHHRNRHNSRYRNQCAPRNPVAPESSQDRPAEPLRQSHDPGQSFPFTLLYCLHAENTTACSAKNTKKEQPQRLLFFDIAAVRRSVSASRTGTGGALPADRAFCVP